MIDEPKGAQDARATDAADALPRTNDCDPMLSALGYEAADPSLQARLWGESAAASAWEP